MTTVETEHLVLRPWLAEDGLELERLLADPAVRSGRNFPPERIGRLAEHALRQWHVNGFGPWAAIERASGCWIGRIGLDELDDWPDVNKIEVGFELHPAWWGRGLATEGALAALRLVSSSTDWGASSALRRPRPPPHAESWRRPGSNTKERATG